jgi:hypothetical protein
MRTCSLCEAKFKSESGWRYHRLNLACVKKMVRKLGGVQPPVEDWKRIADQEVLESVGERPGHVAWAKVCRWMDVAKLRGGMVWKRAVENYLKRMSVTVETNIDNRTRDRVSRSRGEPTKARRDGRTPAPQSVAPGGNPGGGGSKLRPQAAVFRPATRSQALGANTRGGEGSMATERMITRSRSKTPSAQGGN